MLSQTKPAIPLTQEAHDDEDSGLERFCMHPDYLPPFDRGQSGPSDRKVVRSFQIRKVAEYGGQNAEKKNRTVDVTVAGPEKQKSDFR